MSISMPEAGNLFLPAVPTSLKAKDPELFAVLTDWRRLIAQKMQGLYLNDSALRSAIDPGVSGTFSSTSATGALVVTSGVITSITT